VLVSPRTATRAGSVEVVQVVNGVRHVLASSSDTQLAAGQWGEVTVSYIDGVMRVAVTGMAEPYLTFAPPAQYRIGPRFGLIGSWNLVQFDDFVVHTQSRRF
jgi:hypothetical protein